MKYLKFFESLRNNLFEEINDYQFQSPDITDESISDKTIDIIKGVLVSDITLEVKKFKPESEHPTTYHDLEEEFNYIQLNNSNNSLVCDIFQGSDDSFMFRFDYSHSNVGKISNLIWEILKGVGDYFAQNHVHLAGELKTQIISPKFVIIS